MEFDLQPGISLQSGTFSAVVAPEELILVLLNGADELQRFMFLFVSGSCSRLLSGIGRTSTRFDIRRAFTSHQLLGILQDAYHTVVFIEHDGTLYDGAPEMLEPVSAAMGELARSALVILYTPRRDAEFDALARRADRFFVFFNPAAGRYARRGHAGRPGGMAAPAQPRTGGQMTLEGL
jgi:DNA polymerase I